MRWLLGPATLWFLGAWRNCPAGALTEESGAVRATDAGQVADRVSDHINDRVTVPAALFLTALGRNGSNAVATGCKPVAGKEKTASGAVSSPTVTHNIC